MAYYDSDTVSVGTPDDMELLSLPPSPCVVNFSRRPLEERQSQPQDLKHLVSRKNYLLQKIDNIRSKEKIKGLDIEITSQVDLNPRLQAQWDQACRSASEQFRNIILLQLQEDVAKISAQLCACRPPAASEVPAVDPANQNPPPQTKQTIPQNNPAPLSNVLFPLMWNPPREPPKWKGVKPCYPSGFSGSSHRLPVAYNQTKSSINHNNIPKQQKTITSKNENKNQKKKKNLDVNQQKHKKMKKCSTGPDTPSTSSSTSKKSNKELPFTRFTSGPVEQISCKDIRYK